jgi:hypothetical protein
MRPNTVTTGNRNNNNITQRLVHVILKNVDPKIIKIIT